MFIDAKDVTKVTFVLFCSALLVSVGCSSRKGVVEKYTKEGETAETTQRATDAEGYYLSAVERSRALDPAMQADALYNLGRFYRQQARFAEAARALEQSGSLARNTAQTPDGAHARRELELARCYAALNRWQEGAAALRRSAEGWGALSAEGGKDARALSAVYFERLQQLGLDSTGLPQ